MGRSHSHPHLPLPWCSNAVGGLVLWGSPLHDEAHRRGVVHPDSGSTHLVWHRKENGIAPMHRSGCLCTEPPTSQAEESAKSSVWSRNWAAACPERTSPKHRGWPLGQPVRPALTSSTCVSEGGGLHGSSPFCPPHLPRPSPTPTAAVSHREDARQTRQVKAGLGVCTGATGS